LGVIPTLGWSTLVLAPLVLVRSQVYGPSLLSPPDPPCEPGPGFLSLGVSHFFTHPLFLEFPLPSLLLFSQPLFCSPLTRRFFAYLWRESTAAFPHVLWFGRAPPLSPVLFALPVFPHMRRPILKLNICAFCSSPPFFRFRRPVFFIPHWVTGFSLVLSPIIHRWAVCALFPTSSLLPTIQPCQTGAFPSYSPPCNGGGFFTRLFSPIALTISSSYPL